MKKTLATKQVFNYKTSKNRKTKIITKNRKMKMISLRTITIRKPQASGKLYLHFSKHFSSKFGHQFVPSASRDW
jgi:hypothetical protein